MPKWVWWIILLVVAVLIWRGQGAAVGQAIGKFVTGVFTVVGNIKL
jgi:preprotein translocase subunit SecG